MEQIPSPEPTEAIASKRAIWKPFAIGAVAVAALAGTLGAVSVASAQSGPDVEVPTSSISEPSTAVEVIDVDGTDLEGMDLDDFEISPEDEAIFDQFDQCLTDNGLTEELFDNEEWTDADEAAADTAFEACDPILDGLSDELKAIEAEFDDMDFDDMDFEDFEISREDEAIFDQFDQCLTDNGLTEELFDNEEWTDADEAAADTAFEACDPILDGLSDELKAIEAEFEGCDDEDSDNEDSDIEDSDEADAEDA